MLQPNHAMLPILGWLAEGNPLPRDMALRGFQLLMNGGATPAQMAAFLMAMRIRGESVEEIAAGAEALRMRAVQVSAPPGTIDTCGTGGDGKSSYNISTTVAFVLAACGLPVAKHGNRSVSSRSGSADVLAALGVKIDVDSAVVEACLRECSMAFIYAPRFHTAMRHIAPVRQELGLRTIFNLLGPLSNPAKPDFQLLGVYDRHLLEPMARVLSLLGTKAAWVVHGADGMDELSLSGVSYVCELRKGAIRTFEVTPEDAGLSRAVADALKGEDPEHNALALKKALSGAEGTYKQAVIYNAAAALMVAGRADNLKDAAGIAAEHINNGAAYRKIQQLVERTNQPS